MIWLHPALLFGLALTVIPVLLHLLMRAKPKKLVFPALRLIQNRKRTNVRRLRLRHLALLLLRMAVIALIVLAVARPSVPAADYSLRGGDWLRLLLIAAVTACLYLGLVALWNRRQLPPHELTYRRSYLRAGLAIAALVGIGLLVVLPYQRRISASITQPTLAPSEFLPVAAVMLFDTSLSMQYRHESRTRLEMAQGIATRHLGSLPRSSRVAIGDTTGESPIRFQGEISAANKQIAALGVSPIARPLDDRLLAAIEAQIEDQERDSSPGSGSKAVDLLREIYVFTDLAASAWRKDDSPRLKEALARGTGVSVYLIDVGVASPTNMALTELALAEQSVPRGGEATIRATLEAAGIATLEQTLELHVENEAGQMIPRGKQSIRVDPSAAATALFSVRAGSGSVLQGEIRLLASDPLPFDDVRSFTLQLEPSTDVLVVTDNPEEPNNSARFFEDALVSLRELKYRKQSRDTSQLGSTDLSKFDLVALVNVADPKLAGWRKLADYLAGGGNVLIVLGDRVNHDAYRSPGAGDVLPGGLKARLRFDPPMSLDFSDLTHPMVRKLPDGAIPFLTSAPIHEYWYLDPAPHDTAVIVRYTHDLRRGALIEGAQGKGRVLVLTTSLDRNWNELPVAGWSYLALIDQMLRYLTRSAGDVYNYTIGETVSISLDPGLALPGYLLRKPGLQQLRSELSPGASRVTVQGVDQIGRYRLTGVDPQAKPKFERGFSVNPDRAESDLARLTKDDLDSRFGRDRYSLARDVENLARNVRAGRLGRDAFPLLALVLLAAFLGEHFIANRFYDKEAPLPAT
jgi:Aerotolerance regulator N-terminal